MHEKNPERLEKEGEWLSRLKHETAKELGINLNPAPGEKISARDAGKVGGNMVRKMIRDYAGSHSPSKDSVK